MRIYLAATEDVYRGRADVQVRRLLISYFGPEERLHRALSICKPQDWCVDSGAHFFLTEHFKHQRKPPVEEVEEHIARCLAFLRALPTKPAFAVEMDLQDMYGDTQVEKWRDRYWRPYEQETGVEVCYVWHMPDGQSGWDALVADPTVSRIGVGGTSQIGMKTSQHMLLAAYRAGKPVHGFAGVKEKLLKRVPYASVDSTSWGSASLFGRVPHFDHMTGRMRSGEAGRGMFKRNRSKAVAAVLKAGKGRVRVSDTLGVKAGGDLSRVYRCAADAYAEMEDWYSAYWRCKGIDWDGGHQGHQAGGDGPSDGADGVVGAAADELPSDDRAGEGDAAL